MHERRASPRGPAAIEGPSMYRPLLIVARRRRSSRCPARTAWPPTPRHAGGARHAARAARYRGGATSAPSPHPLGRRRVSPTRPPATRTPRHHRERRRRPLAPHRRHAAPHRRRPGAGVAYTTYQGRRRRLGEGDRHQGPAPKDHANDGAVTASASTPWATTAAVEPEKTRDGEDRHHPAGVQVARRDPRR